MGQLQVCLRHPCVRQHSESPHWRRPRLPAGLPSTDGFFLEDRDLEAVEVCEVWNRLDSGHFSTRQSQSRR